MRIAYISLFLFFCMLSQGYSAGWIYGPNLIQNGNFSEVRSDNASLPRYWYIYNYSDCSSPDTVWNFSQIGYIPNEYVNITSDGFENLVSAPILLEGGKYYYLSFDVLPYNIVGLDGMMRFVSNDSVCSPAWTPAMYITWNSSDATVDRDIFFSLDYSPTDGGWYKLSGILSRIGYESNYALLEFAQIYLANYSIDNVVLKEATYLNDTAIQRSTFSEAHNGDSMTITANVTDLMTNLSVTYGTMSINYSKPDSSSFLKNLTYNSTSSFWETDLTFDMNGIWILDYTYFGGSDYDNSTNSSHGISVLPVPSGGSGGGGGSQPNATNQTLNKTIDIYIEGIDWKSIDTWLNDRTYNFPNTYILIAVLAISSYAFRKRTFVSIVLIGMALYILMKYA